MSQVSAGTIRSRVLGRAMREANHRANARVDRFLDASFELLGEVAPTTDFSVNDVVARSGQSLRSFYSYYRSRDELLLAMLEDAVLASVERLQAAVATESDASARLRTMLLELHRCARPQTRRTRKRQHPLHPRLLLRVLTADPAAAARLLAPVVDLLERAYLDAAGTESVLSEGRRRRIVGTIVQVVLLDEFSRVIAPIDDGDRDPAEEAWALIEGGLGASNRQGGNCRG